MSEYKELNNKIWYRGGDGFTIEIVCHLRGFDITGFGEYTWNVYVYLQNSHSLFHKILENYHEDVSKYISFHGGCTFSEWSSSFLKEYKKLGCDYIHFGDERFSFMSTPEEAKEIFDDADKLFEFFNNYKKDESC